MNHRTDHVRLVGLLNEVRATHQRTARRDAVLDEIEVLARAYMRDETAIDWLGYHLTGMETRFAELLHTKLNKTVTHEQVMDALYFDRGGEIPESNNVSVQVCKLRQKLEGSPLRIRTIWGVGFRMEAATAKAA